MDITPRDPTETQALSLGKRITIALGIVISSLGALLAAIGGLDWITEHLPLLGTGLASLVTGALTAYVAVRRMRVDKIAKSAALLAFILLPSAFILCSGCVAIRADSDDKGASVLALGWGADSSAQLANVAVTGPMTNGQTGVSFDSANGEQKSYQAIQSLVALGAALAPILAGVPATKPVVVTPDDPAPEPETADVDSATEFSAAGYDGVPGPTGEGVYGRPSCTRCRAYHAAHPDVRIINIDIANHKTDMWAALGLRNHPGGSVTLPVLITSDAYVLSAK